MAAAWVPALQSPLWAYHLQQLGLAGAAAGGDNLESRKERAKNMSAGTFSPTRIPTELLPFTL